MYDQNIVKKLMGKVLVEFLKFIESFDDKFPLHHGEHFDISVDYVNKQWCTYSKRAINLDKWKKG